MGSPLDLVSNIFGVVKGGVDFVKTGTATNKNSLISLNGFTNYLLSVLGIFVLAVIILYFLPALTAEIINISSNKTLRAFGIGLGTYIVTPLVFFILVISIVGIMLGFAFTLTVATLSIFSYALSSIFIGQLILNIFSKSKQERIGWKTIVLGSIILPLIGFIPFIGSVIQIIIVAIVFGAFIEYFLSQRQKPLTADADKK